MLYATRYDILRGVTSSSKVPVAMLKEGPEHVALLLNEQKFVESGGALKHWDSVMLDDRMHDWAMKGSNLHYYSHAVGLGETVDVLLVYESEDCRRERPSSSAA